MKQLEDFTMKQVTDYLIKNISTDHGISVTLDSFELLIQNGSKIYYPIVEDKVKLTWERKGTPGKLEFTVVKDGNINFQEGKHTP